MHKFKQILFEIVHNEHMGKHGPGSGGAREGSGRPRLFEEKTAPVRIPESMAQQIVEAIKEDKPRIEDILKKGDELSLDAFDSLPTYVWDVTEILPNVNGGITARSHMTFVGNEVQPLREHIRKLVENGSLRQGTIRRTSPFAIEVFFGHPGWTGDSIGYRIDLAPDQYNFTTLRNHCKEHLLEGDRSDFVGPIIVHQSNADTIKVTRDVSNVTIDLLRDPGVPTRYAAFEAPDTKTFVFDTEEAATYAQHVAQEIINRSTAYMNKVFQEFGIGKYQRSASNAEN